MKDKVMLKLTTKLAYISHRVNKCFWVRHEISSPIASVPPMTGLVSPGLWNVDSSELGSSLVKLEELIILPADPLRLCVGLLVEVLADGVAVVDT